MSNRVSLSLARNFKQVSGASYPKFLNDKFPIACDIPGEREPEFGYLMERMESAYALDVALADMSNFRLIGKPSPDTGYVLSLPQDTVDNRGNPTHLIAKNNVEQRRRFNFNASTGELKRFDVSFKDAGKSKHRREWEANASCLRSGMTEATAKVVVDVPEIAAIPKDNYRVMGAIMVSRQITNFAYMMRDQSAVITWEANNDAGIITTPHANQILGYRREKEFEAISVHLKPRSKYNSDDGINEILDRAINEVRETIETGSFRDAFGYTEISKGADTIQTSAEHYEKSSLFQSGSGRDSLLLQNVRAEEFYGKISNLFQLSTTIPSPLVQHQATQETRYNGEYFRSPEKATRHPLRLIAV